jgi:hypothetical protein
MTKRPCALALNLAIWLGPELSQELASLGRPLPDYQGNGLDAADPGDLRGRPRRLGEARFVDPDFRHYRRAEVGGLKKIAHDRAGKLVSIGMRLRRANTRRRNLRIVPIAVGELGSPASPAPVFPSTLTIANRKRIL